MGYELKLIIGKTSSTTQPVLARSTEKYEDGSGYKYLKDAKGNVIPTGRTETWFRDMAHIDLCCIGTGSLSNLVTATQKGSKCPKHTLYFFSDDGNTQITEDKYGAPFKAVPVKEVLKALQDQQKAEGPYRRYNWAIALLKSMVKDPDGLEVLFFGH
jgi:hypothetical protein